MAFHVACPITCKRICFCTLGFPRHLHHQNARDSFFNDVCRIEGFLSEKWQIQPCISATVDVPVPHVDTPPIVPPTTAVAGDVAGDGDFALLSAQNKRAAMQKKAAATSVAFEDYARRFEAGFTGVEVADFAKDEQNPSAGNIMCRLCFFGENEASERAMRMLSCKGCGKKYHRNCLGDWAHHRDLFYWSSWKCPSCRVCEVCRRTGDPNKFMFCKRCDNAYHCYCQHPPHKNVSSGPYLCPKHTKCHSCGSTVPGNGLSTRWFLGYTCCDACGRLFVKGNYCPVCLKVYRDSESTPMVCCDVCQRWVHCQCDGISDEKYLQFQVDRDLSYRCGTCRGECYQVKDIDDAVQELWRRRDKADQGLIASLRTAAGLPSQEEIFSISPFSDDEDNGPIKSKNEYGRSLKFSFKGFVDKSPKNPKEHFKNVSKYSKKKKKDTVSVKNAELLCSSEEKSDVQFFGYDGKNDMPVYRSNEETNRVSFLAVGSNGSTEGASSINERLVSRKTVNEFTHLNDMRNPKDTQVGSTFPHGVGATENVEVRKEKVKNMKGKKLVIHLGARNRNTTDTQISDGSCCQREDFPYSNGGEGNSQQVSENITTDRHDDTSILQDIRGPIYRGREENYTNFSTRKSEYLASGTQGGAFPKDTPSETVPPKRSDPTPPLTTGDRTSLRKHHKDGFRKGSRTTYDAGNAESQSFVAEVKPVLKLKIKNPNLEGQMQWGSSRSEEDRSAIKGQRSKRKRLAIQPAKAFSSVDEIDTSENSRDEMMDANWILKKLGMDAVGKRVEVQQPDGFWAKGTVMGVSDGNSTLSVELDDGLVRPLNLGGEQGIRFISQKNKRRRT